MTLHDLPPTFHRPPTDPPITFHRRYLSAPAAKPGLQKQVVIFKDKHTYWATYLYAFHDLP